MLIQRSRGTQMVLWVGVQMALPLTTASTALEEASVGEEVRVRRRQHSRWSAKLHQLLLNACGGFAQSLTYTSGTESVLAEATCMPLPADSSTMVAKRLGRSLCTPWVTSRIAMRRITKVWIAFVASSHQRRR